MRSIDGSGPVTLHKCLQRWNHGVVVRVEAGDPLLHGVGHGTRYPPRSAKPTNVVAACLW
jgi:hypothetical protein